MSTPPTGGPGRGRLLDRLPAPAFFVLTAVVLFGIGAGARLLAHDLDAEYLVIRGIAALAIAGVTTARFVRTRRAVGGPEGLAPLRGALRTGELPADVPVHGWQEELDRRERILRRSRWTAPVLCAVLALIGVVIALTATRTPAVGWLLVGIAVVLGTVAVVRVEQVLPRIESLRSQLDARG